MARDRDIVILIEEGELAYMSMEFIWIKDLLTKKKRLGAGASLHGTRDQLLKLAARIVKEVEEES